MKKILLLVLLASGALFAAEQSQVNVGVGVFNFTRHKHKTVEAMVEYEPWCEWHTIRPLLGVMVTGESALYLYSGFSLDWHIKKYFLFSPDFAAGYYHRGGGKRLGFPLEFRSGIKMGWEFDNHVRIGAYFYHISNAHLGHKNPGEESLEIFLAIPF